MPWPSIRRTSCCRRLVEGEDVLGGDADGVALELDGVQMGGVLGEEDLALAGAAHQLHLLAGGVADDPAGEAGALVAEVDLALVEHHAALAGEHRLAAAWRGRRGSACWFCGVQRWPVGVSLYLAGARPAGRRRPAAPPAVRPYGACRAAGAGCPYGRLGRAGARAGGRRARAGPATLSETVRLLGGGPGRGCAAGRSRRPARAPAAAVPGGHRAADGGAAMRRRGMHLRAAAAAGRGAAGAPGRPKDGRGLRSWGAAGGRSAEGRGRGGRLRAAGRSRGALSAAAAGGGLLLGDLAAEVLQQRVEAAVEALADGGEPPDVLEVEVAQHHRALGGELGAGEGVPGDFLAARDDPDVARADLRHLPGAVDGRGEGQLAGSAPGSGRA